MAEHIPVVDDPNAPKNAYQITRMPKTYAELYHFVRAVYGLTIPSVKVCKDHSTPFNAFAEAYFARNDIAVWEASRGFGGKTQLLGTLGLMEATTLNAQVAILGGSGAQSLRAYEATREGWASPNAPRHLLSKEPTRFMTAFKTNAYIETLMASQRSVRGIHPQRLRLDEVDEMDLPIFNAALGTQMMGKKGLQKGIQTHVVVSSTHQYPDGCIGGKSLVLTHRGEIPIAEVTTDDQVMTRKGWRQVESVICTGYRPVIELQLSNGRKLVCTDDHQIATGANEWMIPQWMDSSTKIVGINTQLIISKPRSRIRDHPKTCTAFSGLQSGSDAVAGFAFPTISRVDPSVGGCESVAFRASGLVCIDSGGTDSTQYIRPLSDIFQMVDIAAIPVLASPFFNVIDLPFGHTNQADVCPTMDSTFVLLPVDVPVSTRMRSIPAPTSTLFVDSAPLQEPVTVIDCHTIRILQPVYDLQVNDVHEFVAEGVVVHNTFTEVIKRSKANGWTYHRWCMKETSNVFDGWLTQPEIDRKRKEVPQAMWEAEYELQEPSFEGRAFNTAAVEYAFAGEEIETDRWAMKPMEHSLHVTGIDWAKEVDLTVMATFDTQAVEVTAQGEKVWHCVAWEYSSRVPWPAQVNRAEQRYRVYPGYLAHDSTGLGNVLTDYFDADLRRKNRERICDIVMSGGSNNITGSVYGKVGVNRTTLFSDYIAAIENGLIRYPRIKMPFDEHRYCSMNDLFGSGHPPDSVVAGSMAWAMRAKVGQRLIPNPTAVTRSNPFDIMQRESL
jgi:hypothetical protein